MFFFFKEKYFWAVQMLGVSASLLALPEFHIPIVKNLTMANQCIHFSHKNVVWQTIWYGLKFDKEMIDFPSPGLK